MKSKPRTTGKEAEIHGPHISQRHSATGAGGTGNRPGNRAAPGVRGPSAGGARREPPGGGPGDGGPPPGAGAAEGPHDPGPAGGGGPVLFRRGGRDWLDAAIILLIVVVNAVISISQEDNARKALEALREALGPPGPGDPGRGERRLESTQLVPGDIVLLEAGDYVPADGRILGRPASRRTSRP